MPYEKSPINNILPEFKKVIAVFTISPKDPSAVLGGKIQRPPG